MKKYSILILGSAIAALLFLVLSGIHKESIDYSKKHAKISVSNDPAEGHDGQHERDVSAINDTWEYIRSGNELYKLGDYEKAAFAYQRAYTLDRGSRGVSGFKLVMVFEQLKRYDEGVRLLDQMMNDKVLSANGVLDATSFKSRLLAAKAQAEQKTEPQSP